MVQPCGYARVPEKKKCQIKGCKGKVIGFAAGVGHRCWKHWNEYWEKADADTGGY